MNEKYFVFVFLTSLLLLTTSVSFFNYKIDSYYQFSRSQILGKAVDDLLAGKMILGIEDFLRNEQKLIIEKMKNIPDIIVLGSSRSYTIRASFLGLEKTDNYFNHSVGNANLKDYIAILGAYKIKGDLPKTIIIEVEPRLFDKRWNEYLSSWQMQSMANEYYYFIEILDCNTPKIPTAFNNVIYKVEMTKELISYYYTIANIQTLLSGEDFEYRIANCMNSNYSIKMPDGSLCYPFYKRFRYESFTPIENKRFLNNMKAHIYEQSLQRVFIDLIDYLVNNGTQILFYLPPYNPITYTEINKNLNLQYVHNCERMIRDLANSKKILVIGSYNPNAAHLSHKDFFDAQHINNDLAMENIFKRYKKIINRNKLQNTDKNSEVVKVEPVHLEYHLVEAEHADSIEYPLEVVDDKNISEGKCISSPKDKRPRYKRSSIMATYSVTISQTGEYILWGRVKASNGAENSFFVEIDNGSDNLWEVALGGQWHWDAVNYRDREDPVKFTLLEGKHKIIVKLREGGTKLDKLLLTNDPYFMPDGERGVTDNPVHSKDS